METPAINKNITEEIRLHLHTGDYSLAVRRLLDIVFEINDSNIAYEAIDISRQLRQATDAGITDDQYYINLRQNCLDLLARIDQKDTADAVSFVRIGDPVFSGQKISKTYTHGVFTLHPLDVVIRAGELTGVVGENGNGKTTLLRIIATELQAEGNMAYPLVKPGADYYYRVKHHIAYIPQRIPRWYGKLENNLKFSATVSGLLGRDNEEMVDLMLERLGLSKFRSLTWGQISSGYRTRFELARMLVRRPALLVLDEPLANLDINAQQTFLQDLRYLAKSAAMPMGVIFSSQQLHEVEKAADHILFLKAGKCLYNSASGDAGFKPRHIIELETDADKQVLAQLFAGISDCRISFNGGMYTISVPDTIAEIEMLRMLMDAGITIHYYRNISKSTKRLFNQAE